MTTNINDILALCQQLDIELATIQATADKATITLFPDNFNPTGLSAIEVFGVIATHLNENYPRSTLLSNDPILIYRNQVHDMVEHVQTNLGRTLSPKDGTLTNCVEAIEISTNLRFFAGRFFLIPNTVNPDDLTPEESAEWASCLSTMDGFQSNLNEALNLIEPVINEVGIGIGSFDLFSFDGKPMTVVIDAFNEFSKAHPEPVYAQISRTLIDTFATLLLYIDITVFEVSVDQDEQIPYDQTKAAKTVQGNKPSYLFTVYKTAKTMPFTYHQQ